MTLCREWPVMGHSSVAVLGVLAVAAVSAHTAAVTSTCSILPPRQCFANPSNRVGERVLHALNASAAAIECCAACTVTRGCVSWTALTCTAAGDCGCNMFSTVGGLKTVAASDACVSGCLSDAECSHPPPVSGRSLFVPTPRTRRLAILSQARRSWRCTSDWLAIARMIALNNNDTGTCYLAILCQSAGYCMTCSFGKGCGHSHRTTPHCTMLTRTHPSLTSPHLALGADAPWATCTAPATQRQERHAAFHPAHPRRLDGRQAN